MNQRKHTHKELLEDSDESEESTPKRKKAKNPFIYDEATGDSSNSSQSSDESDEEPTLERENVETTFICDEDTTDYSESVQNTNETHSVVTSSEVNNDERYEELTSQLIDEMEFPLELQTPTRFDSVLARISNENTEELIPFDSVIGYITDRTIIHKFKSAYKHLILSGTSYDANHCEELDVLMETIDVYVNLSAKGLGKTFAIEEFICDSIVENPNTTVVSISPRIVFSDFFCKSLNDKLEEKSICKRMSNYTRLREKYIGDVQLLSIQLNSISRLSKDNAVKSYDILILDEIKATLRIFSAGTLKDRIEITTVFIKLIKNAKKIIIADADFDQETLELLCIIFNLTTDELIGIEPSRQTIFGPNTTPEKKIHLSINIRKNDTNRYHIYNKKGKLFKILEKKLTAGKKVLVPTNSLYISKEVYAFISIEFPDKKILLINSETTVIESQYELAHDSKKWKDESYDVVIFSPTITVGISIDYLYFNTLIALFVPGSSCSTECVQMLSRCRTLIDGTIYIYLPTQSKEKYIVDEETLSSEIRKKYNDVVEKSRNLSNGGWEFNTDFKVMPLLNFEKTLFLQIELNNMKERRKSQNLFRSQVLDTIKKTLSNDSNLEIHDIGKLKKGIYSAKEIRLFVKTHETNTIFEAEDLNLQVILELKTKTHKSQSEIASIKRHFFKEFYHTTNPPKTFIFDWYSRNHHVEAFRYCFIASDAELKRNNYWTFETHKSEHLLFFNFVWDHKTILFEILGKFGFDYKKPWEFKVDDTKKNTERDNFIAEKLTNFIYKGRKHILPIKITSVFKLLLDIFRIFGLDLIKTETFLSLDLKSMVDMYAIMGSRCVIESELAFAKSQLENIEEHVEEMQLNFI